MDRCFCVMKFLYLGIRRAVLMRKVEIYKIKNVRKEQRMMDGNDVLCFRG